MGFYRWYSRLFTRKWLFKWHKRLYLLGLRGMGMLNHEDDFISGESYFQKWLQGRGIKVIFDVGANKGQYAQLARKHHPRALIYSFEPHPASFKCLIDQVKDQEFKAFNIGLGAEEGELNLYDYTDEPGSEHASLCEGVMSNLYDRAYTSTTVKVESLDGFCKKYEVRFIDLLKIDVEGYELEVLKGARNLIEEGKVSIIQFEFNANHVFSKVSMSDFKGVLKGFDFYRLLPDGMVDISTESTLFTEIYAFQNIVAVKKAQG